MNQNPINITVDSSGFCDTMLSAYLEGYKAACQMNQDIFEPWSEENRHRNQIYIKGVIEGQDRLQRYLGINGTSKTLSVDTEEWKVATVMGQFMIGMIHGFDNGCIKCFCNVDPNFEDDTDDIPLTYLD